MADRFTGHVHLAGKFLVATEHQDGQQQGRMIRGRARAAVTATHRAQVQTLHHFDTPGSPSGLASWQLENQRPAQRKWDTVYIFSVSRERFTLMSRSSLKMTLMLALL